MIQCRIPSIEEIYNELHRENFYARKGFYPRSIKNFDSVLDKEKRELLCRFQQTIRRNADLIDWKIYIKANAQYFKGRLEVKTLGSLQANKVYRTYIEYNKDLQRTPDDIRHEIIRSLKFIRDFCEDNAMTLRQYFLDRQNYIPIILTHLYSGAVSPYLYALFPNDQMFLAFGDIPDDVYEELFRCTRNELLEYNLKAKRKTILSYPVLTDIINKIEQLVKL